MIGFNSNIVDCCILIFSTLLFLVLSYLIGISIINVDSKNEHRKVFYNTLLGSLVIICVFSFFHSGIKTVNAITIALIIYLASFNKAFFKVDWKSFKKLLPYLYIVPVVFILFSVYRFPDSINNDFKYYSKIVYSLTNNGNENFYHFFNDYDKGFNGITPYHYTEFWFAGMFNQFTHTIATISLKYFSYPLIVSLCSFGFISFYSKNHFFYFILFLLTSLLVVGQYVSFIDMGWEVITDFWRRPNFITYYLIFILLYNAILDNNYRLFYIFISIGFTFSFVIVPCVFIALCLLNSYLVFRKKLDVKLAIKHMLLPTLTVICLLVVYRIFSSGINVTTSFNTKEVLLYNLKIWKAVIFCGSIILFEALIIPVLYLVFNKLKGGEKSNHNFILFIMLMIIIGVGMFQLLTQIDNSYQFAYFAYAGVGFIFMIFFVDVIKFFNSYLIKSLILAIASVVLIVHSDIGMFNFSNFNSSLSNKNLAYENVSENYSKKLSNYLNSCPGAKGAYVFSSGLKDVYRPKDRHSLTKQVGSYVAFITDNCNLMSIACKDSLLVDYNELNKPSFNKAMSWLKALPLYTQECNPVNYLKNSQFDYFICDINMPVQDSTLYVLKDESSKTKAVFLKNKFIQSLPLNP